MAGNGKIAAAGLGSILVVAMVVAAVVISHKSSQSGDGHVSSSNKAANALCSQTDYKETCHKSLEKSDSSDPKQLIQAAFEYTVENIDGVVKESTLLKEASQDKSVQGALHVCEEVLNTAVEDLKRSFELIGEHDSEKSREIVEDLKTWLSAVRTYQETCIDAFEKTEGETGEKIKDLLKIAKELASNALAMVDEISSMLTTLDMEGFKSGRRLLDENEGGYFDYDFETLKAAKKNAPPLPQVEDAVKRALYDFNSPPAGTANINAVVAQDGSAQYKTINDALKAIPPYNNNTFVVYIKAGVYNEEVVIPKYTNKVVFLGEGPEATRITGSKSFGDGVKTFFTATVGEFKPTYSISLIATHTCSLFHQVSMAMTSWPRTSDSRTAPALQRTKPWPFASPETEPWCSIAMSTVTRAVCTPTPTVNSTEVAGSPATSTSSSAMPFLFSKTAPLLSVSHWTPRPAW